MKVYMILVTTILLFTAVNTTRLEAQDLYYSVPLCGLPETVPEFSFDYVEITPEMMLRRYREYNKSIDYYSVIPARFVFDIIYFRFFDISA
ncbi:MAG: hypothetical protein AB1454_01905 [Candidatus Auribacterota bacterium]